MIPTLPENTEKFCVNGTHLLEYTPKNSYKKVPTLHKKYRKFLEKKYPSHEKSTEILLKKGTHLAKKIQKISRKQPVYSLA